MKLTARGAGSGGAPAAEVIVVGLGAMGSAVCFQLASRGASVVGFDRFCPPHPRGSSHGETRITRLAIGEGPEYVPLVRRSHELWAELERLGGERLLIRTGGLVLGRPGSAFLGQTVTCARRYGIAHEELAGAEIKDRFPMFEAGADTIGYYEPEAGYVRPEAAIRTQLELARRRGAELHTGESVERWRAGSGHATVETAAGRYSARNLVLCAGAWIPQLFPEGRELFAVHRQLLFWFPIRGHYEQLRAMPVFVWDLAGEQHGFVHLSGFYGFPAIDGHGGGVKVATESYERTTTPDVQQHPATAAESEAMYERCIAPHLPWLGSPPLRSVPCLYTSTRGSRFVIDRHPEHDSVWIVSPCSGHGFKHSPAIGEALAQLLSDGVSDIDLTPFALERAERQPPSPSSSALRRRVYKRTGPLRHLS